MSQALIVVILIAALIAALWVRLQLATTTVFEFERGLRFSRGHFRGVLEPGLYRHLRAYTAIRKLDIRPAQAAVNSQEVLSADGVAVKASLSATYRVVDPMKALLESENFLAALHTDLQQALRVAIARVPVEELLATRAALGAQIEEQVKPTVSRLGLELISVAVRDLTLPGELKKIFAQVVKARQEGLASLERARGETAALRSLANAAQMVQRNPSLMQLRLLQVLGQQSGNTLVVGMPQGITPLPLKAEGEVGDPGKLTDGGTGDE